MKKYIKVVVLTMIVALFVPFYCAKASDIDSKVNTQEEGLINKMKDIEIVGDNELDGIINSFEDNMKNSNGEFNGKQIKSKLNNLALKGAVTLRKLVIPIYMLIIIYTILMTGIKGNKSVKNQRHYMLISIGYTVLFLFLINLPLIIIYFSYMPINEIFTANSIYKTSLNFFNFLSLNSLVISIIMILYGVLNLILSKFDVSRRLQGRFLVKMAFIFFFVVQTLDVLMIFVL